MSDQTPKASRITAAAVLIGLWLFAPMGIGVARAGPIVSWGSDSLGQVSDTPAVGGFVDIAAGDAHSLALTSAGSIVSWGSDGYGQVSGTPAGGGFVAIDAGYGHSLALTPEPATLTLLAAGLGALVVRKRRT